MNSPSREWVLNTQNKKKKSKLFYSNKLIMIIVFSLGKTLFRIPKSYGSIWIELIIVETEN